MEDNSFSQFKIIKPQLQNRFEQHAKEAGWPEMVISQIKVDVKNNNIVLDYPPHLKTQITDLEYGNKQVPPKPAIRRFTANIGTTVSNAAANKILDMIAAIL